MKCPKCQFQQPDDQEICLRCGVVFAKIHAPTVNHDENPATREREKLPQLTAVLKNVLNDIPREENPFVRGGRMLVWLVLVVWGVKFMFTPISGEAFSQSFMHLVNLPFHEAGHIMFAPFGRFIQVLGGTLGQLLVPLIVAGSFASRGNHFGLTVGLWWLGQSLMDCAPYVDDARAGQLILLGGVTGSEVSDYHDWEQILTRLGMMEYDHLIARLFFGSGVLVMVAALAWGGYVLVRQRRNE